MPSEHEILRGVPRKHHDIVVRFSRGDRNKDLAQQFNYSDSHVSRIRKRYAAQIKALREKWEEDTPTKPDAKATKEWMAFVRDELAPEVIRQVMEGKSSAAKLKLLTEFMDRTDVPKVTEVRTKHEGYVDVVHRGDRAEAKIIEMFNSGQLSLPPPPPPPDTVDADWEETTDADAG